MKQLKILGWLFLSLGLGKGLNALFSPSDLLFAMIVYLVPMVLLGIQRESVTAQETLGFGGNRIKVNSVTQEWITFWGIRLGAGQEMERTVDWLPDTDLNRLAAGTSSLLVQVLPMLLTGIPRFSLGKLS